MTLAQAKNCLENNIPVWWHYKKWRRVLIDEIITEDINLGRRIIFDEPMVFFKVMYRGHKIVIEDARLKDLYLEKPDEKR